MNTPLYIFDLDGTLALTGHRQHFPEREKPDWNAFFAACDKDEPNTPVISIMDSLIMDGYDVWVFSGRSDAVRAKTEEWLDDNTLLRVDDHLILRMRKEGDYTPDEVLKRQWLHEMSAEDRKRLVAIFDDRDKVVKMWREEGVPCFQVAPGAF